MGYIKHRPKGFQQRLEDALKEQQKLRDKGIHKNYIHKYSDPENERIIVRAGRSVIYVFIFGVLVGMILMSILS